LGTSLYRDKKVVGVFRYVFRSAGAHLHFRLIKCLHQSKEIAVFML
jgi:hypothetical protein